MHTADVASSRRLVVLRMSFVCVVCKVDNRALLCWCVQFTLKRWIIDIIASTHHSLLE